MIGNARDGWSFDRLSGQSTDPDTTFGYRNGKILGSLNHCGWLQARFLGQELDSDDVSDCPQVSPVTGRPGTSRFAASVNCRNCDGGGTIMLREQDVPARGMPFCLNVDPSPLRGAPNYPRTCHDALRNRITKEAVRNDEDQLYALKWRYITRGPEQFVLVQDREAFNDSGHGVGIWGFIPRKYFTNRTFCKRQNRTTPTGRSEDDNKCVIFRPAA